MRKTHVFINAIRKILKDRPAVEKEVALGFLMWVFHVFAAYFLFLSLGYNINPLSILVVFALSYLIGVMLIIPGGIGIMETTMIALYSAQGIDPTIAATVAVIHRLFFYFFALILGYIALIFLNLKNK